MVERKAHSPYLTRIRNFRPVKTLGEKGPFDPASHEKKFVALSFYPYVKRETLTPGVERVKQTVNANYLDVKPLNIDLGIDIFLSGPYGLSMAGHMASYANGWVRC